MRCLPAVLLFALLGLSSGAFTFRGSQWRSMNAVVNALPNYTPLPYTNKTVTQPIDHQNPSLGTWQQHYQVMSEYLNKNATSSLVFLMIGGEGPASPAWISNPGLQYMQWARKFGALCFQVEHRFFGASRPYTDMTTDHLKYLNTTQALEDLASFIKGVNNDAKNYGLTNPRWVTFGGSYPGSMAAWFRSKYPELTVGSIASSAPLKLKLDFYGMSYAL
uniref:Serine protease K12H4.7 n=1 Tax=Steinernema glaseri TaxID=37863 RepID=A0A1I8A762_9BILA